MKKRSKIILVLSFVLVFAFSLCINIFADSAGYGDTVLKPVLAPSFVRVGDINEAAGFSGFSDIVVELGSGLDVVYGSTELSDHDEESRGRRDFYLEVPMEQDGDLFSLGFHDFYSYNQLWDQFMLLYNDFYYSGNYFHLFDGYYITSLEFSPSYSVSVYRLECDISYIDSTGSLEDNPHTFSGNSIRAVFDGLEDHLLNYSDGALVHNIVVRPLESTGTFASIDIYGTMVYTYDYVPLGAEAALIDWSDNYGNGVVVESPTVIESVTRGLNAIWDTSLFGTFTIGQVFSACAGFALFGWILKIFNR